MELFRAVNYGLRVVCAVWIFLLVQSETFIALLERFVYEEQILMCSNVHFDLLFNSEKKQGEMKDVLNEKYY